MELEDQKKQRWIDTAERILLALSEVARAAQETLAKGAGGFSSSSLANPSNMMVADAKPERFMHARTMEQRDSLRRLLLEPFVARVEVDWEGGTAVQTYYLARRSAAGLTGAAKDGQFISSGAVIGHLAEYEAGETATVLLPGGERRARILARAVVEPKQHGQEWDAFARSFEQLPWGEALDLLRYESLRKALDALRRAGLPAEDIVGRLLEEAADARQELQRVRRKVVDRIALRDRPILNKFQGAIFRLPLDQQVILFGPPGSGKTTTLIKRLAQKKTLDALTEDEQRLLGNSLGDDFLRPDSWAMFSPGELLKQYLGDAFNKEGVPDAGNVRTWDKERHDLARNVLNILRSNASGRFQLEPAASILVDPSSGGLAQLHDEFAAYVESMVVRGCEEALAGLRDAREEPTRRLAVRIQHTLGREARIVLDDVLRVFGEVDAIQAEIRRLNDRISTELNKATNLLLNTDRGLLDEIVAALPAIRPGEQEDEDEEEDDEEAEASSAPATGRVEALNVLMRALRNRARGLVESRRVASSLAGRIMGLLGDRAPPQNLLAAIGVDIATQARLQTLARGPRSYVRGVPSMYARYRRQAAREARHFIAGEATRGFFARSQISPDELDVLVLSMLRNARRLLEASGARRTGLPTRYDWLEAIRSRYLAQVFVDEATDLSAVQLACTIELADPRLRSWFACGDLRQRITARGLRSENEIEWLDRTTGAKINIHRIDIGYRQTRRLRDLSDAMAALFDANSTTATTAPPGSEEADVWPILAENRSGAALGVWLAARIGEVEKGIGRLPSIAVFVDGDELIDPLVEASRKLLAERNIPIVGCKEGRVVGDAREVRIFDVQHIKGLEFEAVFFVGIDRLAQRVPDLFDRFLYVGLTRAGTYLGVTCEGSLPSKLEPLRPYFGTAEGWAGT